MEWLEVFIETSEEGIEIISGLLYSNGVTGLMIEDKSEFEEFLQNPSREWDYIEDDLVEEKHNKPTGITFFVTDNLNGMETLTAVKGGLKITKERETEFDLGSLEVTIKNIKEEDWANNWKKYFKPFPIGNKIIIKPSWERVAPQEGKAILNIDPGHVFGTGTHETTKCCIELIEDFVKTGDKVLDIGCGSGILSIASLLIGADYTAAVDIDPNAMKIVMENMELNNIAPKRFDVFAGNILEDERFMKIFGGKTYDVVEANIVADVIIALCNQVPMFIKNGGHFITSGIIVDRLEDVKISLVNSGFEILEIKQEKDWVAIASKFIG